MKKILLILPVAAATLFLSGCSLYGSSSQPATVPAGNNNQSQSATPVTDNAVNIQNFAFSPATLTVKKGATVTWTNNDSAPHQIKSATFNSSVLSKGQSFSFTFNSVGTFDYSCAIHPMMTGKIIVE
ncbi:MAG: cupredoxin domain-containing protein [Candidatus Moranbacteria bacterium]|nr:cupredoxin domain-containing protein [Candidatus Moranbacteria bacterium]